MNAKIDNQDIRNEVRKEIERENELKKLMNTEKIGYVLFLITMLPLLFTIFASMILLFKSMSLFDSGHIFKAIFGAITSMGFLIFSGIMISTLYNYHAHFENKVDKEEEKLLKEREEAK